MWQSGKKREQLFREYGVVTFAVLLFVILLLLPTGFEGALSYQNTERVKVQVIETDESNVKDTGLVRTGEQGCTVQILSGILDHYRLDKEVVLLLLFILLLVLFAGKMGVKAIFSFVNTILIVWKVLVPCLLKGWNPIWLSLWIVLSVTVLLLSLIYGLGHRCLAASLGATMGIVVTAVLGIIFTDALKIHGATMEASESLLYAGYQHLDLTGIFMASIFIGAAGAIVDLTVDITSAVYEVVQKKENISAREAISTGMAVGRAACGSTVTTLLLAYSGNYITLLMVFMAQGTPEEFMLNYKYVAAEIVHTIVGSIGLVTVAPFTAVISGFLFVK